MCKKIPSACSHQWGTASNGPGAEVGGTGCCKEKKVKGIAKGSAGGKVGGRKGRGASATADRRKQGGEWERKSNPPKNLNHSRTQSQPDWGREGKVSSI